MVNINVFQLVRGSCEKDLSNFPYFTPYWTLKGANPLFERI